MKKLILLLISAIFLAAISSPYKELDDLEFKSIYSSSFLVQKEYVNYKIYYDDVEFKDFISQYIMPYSSEILTFARSKNLPMNNCISNDYVEVYEVKNSVLNDSMRWPSMSIRPPDLWGIYDTRVSEYNKSSIVISEHREKFGPIFIHELAHFWYDRMCWNVAYGNRDEEFSEQVVDNYFKSRPSWRDYDY